MGKGYGEAGASRTRRALKGFTAQSGSPIEDIDWNNLTLRERGRMLYMGSAVAAAAINTNRTKVVGVGLKLKSAVERHVLGLSRESAENWQDKAEAEFKLWASKKENCDATGLNNFAGMQQLALMSWLMSGDVFALVKRYEPNACNPYSLRLHLVEADRVSTPADSATGFMYQRRTDGLNPVTGNKIHDGVEVDSNGMVVAYHICNTYPRDPGIGKPEWARVEARGAQVGMPNILHVMNSERCDQYRGVTYLAQVIEPLLQLRRYTESELMAALVQSFFSAFVKTEAALDEIPMNEVGDGGIAGARQESPEPVVSGENEYSMGPGEVIHLKPGEDVSFSNPTIPTSGFENFVKVVCQLIGAALELPYDVLMKVFNRTYSASRGAILEAWDAFRMRRQWFVDDFTQPVYEIFLSEAVASGRLKAPGFFEDPLIRAAWCASRWAGPVPGQLDPTKEAKAGIMQVDRAVKTHEQLTHEMGGGNWEENVEQLRQENEKLRQAGGGTYMATLADNDPDKEGG